MPLGPGVRSALILVGALLLITFSLATLIARGGSSPELRVGADIELQALLGELSAAYRTAHPAARVYVDPGAESILVDAVRSHRLDTILLSSDPPRGSGAQVLGDRLLAVAVNPANPLRGLTTPQLQGIWGETLTLWGEAGWDAGGSITPVDRRDDSALRRAFRGAIGLDPSGTPGPNSFAVPGDAEVVNQVAAHPSFTGFVDLRSLTSRVQALQIDGFPASPGATGYPLRRQVWIVGGDSAAAGAFVAFCLGREGQLVVQHYLVPAGIPVS